MPRCAGAGLLALLLALLHNATPLASPGALTARRVPRPTRLLGKGRSIEGLIKTTKQIFSKSIHVKPSWTGNARVIDDPFCSTSFSTLASTSLQKSFATELVEEPTLLHDNMVLELFHRSTVCLGNYVAPSSGSSGSQYAPQAIRVRLENGVETVVDVGQIISVWSDLPPDEVPTSRSSWADVALAAVDLVARLSPRKLDLSEYWSRLHRKTGRVPTDSADVGVYIFQEHALEQWMQPLEADGKDVASIGGFHEPRGSDRADLPSSAISHPCQEELQIWALTPAQRYLACLLLSVDPHFKRRPSQLDVSPSLRDAQVVIREGGYKVLDHGSAQLQRAILLEGVYKSRRIHAPASAAQLALQGESTYVQKLLLAMELMASGVDALQVPPYIRHFFERVGLQPTAQGAAEVLSVFQRPIPGPGGVSNLRGQRDARAASVAREQEQMEVAPAQSPFPYAALQAAKVLKAAQLAHVGAQAEDLRSAKPSHHAPKNMCHVPSRQRYRTTADGRVDLTHIVPTLCVDGPRTQYREDAVSVDECTGVVYVHVVDAISPLLRCETLERTALLHAARERTQTLYLPHAVHPMLPHDALEVLSFGAAREVHEAVTVALRIDAKLGKILGGEVMRSLIRAPTLVDRSTANRLLRSDASAGGSSAHEAMLRKCLRYLLPVLLAGEGEDGIAVIDDLAGALVHALLTRYSEELHRLCKAKGLAVPILYAQRNPTKLGVPMRCGTHPLRSFVSLMQQRQVVHALNDKHPLLGGAKCDSLDLRQVMSVRDCSLVVEEAYQRQRLTMQSLRPALRQLQIFH